MKYVVTEATNFLRVFRLPTQFPSGYCFGGGHPTSFQLVDWFNAFAFWTNDNKELTVGDEKHREHVEGLKDFIRGKMYYYPEYTYMVLTDYGDVFLVNPEKRASELQKELDLIKQETKEREEHNGT